ncbi:MAG: hypothetical protein Q4A83_08055 [Bacillota bacterium]|nr:hypothetical protein [Bacillota bacterium]
MIKSAEFMVRHGMNADRVELDTYSRAVCEMMQNGLKEKQEAVPMIPTYLRGEKQVPRDRKVAVIDAGGTNFRTALVSFTRDGANIENMQRYDMPGAKEPVEWEDFISHTAERLLPIVKDAEAIGFCFSYPAEVTPDKDSRVINLTKQVEIHGAEGKLLGADLMAELMRLGVPEKKIIVLNDTPATLLGGSALLKKSMYGGFVGLVAGTGVNTCCMLPDKKIEKLGIKGNEKMLINLETGSYCGFPQGDIDCEMDSTLSDEGKSTGEKMSSGRYIGQLCLHTLRAAAEEDVFSEKGREFILDLKFLDTPTADKWGSGKLPKGIVGEDAVNMVYIINEIFDRAARCVACILCGILMLTGEGADKPVCIAVDGSLYKKSRLFKPLLEDCMAIYAEEIMGRKYEFVTANEATVLGAAAAVLLN